MRGFRVFGQSVFGVLGRSGGAAAFTPAQLTTLKVWLDAQVLSSLWQLSTLSTAVSANADPVGAWADQSGNGNHVIQATAGNRLAYASSGISGHPSVSLTGGAHKLNVTYAAPIAQPYTILCVFQASVTTTNLYFFAGANSTNALPYLQTGGTNFALNAGADMFDGAKDTNAHIFVLLVNGASSKIYKDGGAASTGNPGAGAHYGLTIGSYPIFTNGMTGSAGEILVLSEASSLATINNVGNYLATKWGIAWSTAS